MPEVTVNFPDGPRRVEADYLQPDRFLSNAPQGRPVLTPRSQNGWEFVQTVEGLWIATERK